MCTGGAREGGFLWLRDTQSTQEQKRRKNRGACGGCSEKNPWLGKRLEMEIENRKMQD